MAGGVDVKMGVSGISQFKSAMSQAQQSVKTLDAALKLNEKQLQVTGDKETYMENKSKLLQQQIKAQTAVVKQGEQALSAMEKNGVNPAGQAYQRMQQQVLTAQTALLGMHDQLSNVGSAAEQTAQKTDDLSASVNSINKKVSFDAVLNGIGRITDGMERAARRIAGFARDAWNTMAEGAAWADNENTLAAMYGLDVETLQRMQGASRTIDTSVESIVKSRQKLKQNMVSDSEDIKAAFIDLGVQTGTLVQGKYGPVKIMREWEDVFWDTGAALLAFDDDVKKDVIANQLFGKSWMELMPLFQAGREEYEKTLAEQSVVSEENVNKLNQLDDALQKLDQDFSTLKSTVLAELAPAFTDLADGFSGLVKQFNEYLQTDEGKEKMEALGEAAGRLFDSLTDIDAGTAIDKAAGALDSVTGALEWIKNNHGFVVGAIKAIGAAFLTMKAAEAGLTLAKTVSGWKGLLGKGGSGAAQVGNAIGMGASAKSAGVLSGIGSAIGSANPFAVVDAAVIAAAITPALLVQAKEEQKAEEQRARRLEIAASGGNTAESIFLSNAANALGLRRDENGQLVKNVYGGNILGGDPVMIEALLSSLGAYQNQQKAELYNVINAYAPTTNDGNYTWNQLQKYLSGEAMDLGSETSLLEAITSAFEQKLQAMEAPKVEVDPELPADAGEMIQSALDANTYTIAVSPYMGAQLDTSMFNIDGEHANGLPFVPFDGYIAALHRGERVVPANQNKSYTANSNLYVEKMYMNNGVNAQGLAAAMAAENRRIRAGFGS